MNQPTAPARQVPLFRRLASGFMALDVRAIAKTNIEDIALAGGYFIVFWLLDAVKLTAFGDLKVDALASAWPAIAVLGCFGVLFRRTAPAATAWMCGLAAVGLLLAGHAGAFVLVFEFFFSVVLFGTAKASELASRSAWVMTAMLVVAVFALSRNASLTVAAGLLGVITFLTPVEWAGNLRKANLLAQSESARADAVHDGARQRLLAERNAHDLALEHERQHLARELHDVISARLSAIALQSGAGLRTVQDGAGTELLRQIRSESVSGLDELNTMIHLLHSGESSEAPGRLAELAPLVESRRAAGLPVRLDNDLDDGGRHLPLPVQTTAYRTVSESLANAAKHAPGEPVAISVAAVPGSLGRRTGNPGHDLLLSVRNPLPKSAAGAAPDATASGTGTGIPSMHFRAAHAGGTLTAGPEGTDWVVILRLPMPPHHNEGPPA